MMFAWMVGAALQQFYQGERTMISKAKLIWCLPGAIVLSLAGVAHSQEEKPGADPKEVQAMIEKARNFLKTKQNPDGSFATKVGGPGVTALVVAGLARNGVSPKDPMMAKAIAYLEKQVKDDGGIYTKGLANYTTSVAIAAFHEINKEGKYDTILKNASTFVKGLQNSDDKSPKFGGFGYDAKSRPDASNTNFAVDALIAAGVPKDDKDIQRAIEFLSRCQNLPGEANPLKYAEKAAKDDIGGFVYVPDPDDKKHATADGGLRSLGAMTYGGLKSFLYAGVDKKDKRVQAAVKWVRNHYTLDENPGEGQAGLYYYYHTFAKAMQAWGEDRFVDAKDVKHDWRRDLFEALKKRQKADGSWVNEGDKTFGEFTPELATAFAMLSLSYCEVKGR
jgi:squalene-hopene/tetraprenyl-beta-curcumene cyclase